MLLIFGTGEKEKPIQMAGRLQCPHCGVMASAVMIKRYRYFHLFYLPLFHYGTAYYLHCPVCQAVYTVDTGKAKLLRDYPDAVAYPQELQTVRRGQKFCIQCGAPLETDALFCSRCGERQC